jgi:AraC-like DNA-binding protein
MFHQRSLLSFVEPSMRRNMPSLLRQLSALSYIDPVDEQGPQLSHRLSWIGDWWFTSVTGRGNLRCRMDPGGILPDDYALLTLALEGQSPVKMGAAAVGKPAGITLTRLDSFYELVSKRPFNHIIVHIPRVDLDRADGAARLGLDRTLPTDRGAGAVLAGALRALTHASEAGAGRDASLRALLPSFAQLVRTGMAQRETAGFYSERSNRRERIMDYLRTHISDRMLISDKVAAACGLSRRQLYREFDGGESFAGMVRRLRIEKAAFELCNEARLGVAEVAHRCGYASADAMAEQFRVFYACSPTEFRFKERKRSLF